ncbi:S-layer homology domain-containing protein [Paenibacillus sp. 19GGS1-52]|uniref:S-layer homology domain-containing protein n=1 Tax=Paenibacillus sp. 19GGS1-52 TaxID=2758563 RepID=UPI001EFAAA65|nr:S-layer homology domain-containing protein [Paenibacillus sp. 19GGS1-52]ULO07935.1 S-layer homology domain-containing protein [Paenibacillus sp. 19GGS1-52]
MSNMSYPSKEETKFMNVQGGEKKVMKKILSVALSTAMAFSMFASVAFGETATTPQAKFDALAAKGVLNGYPDGQAHLEKDLTRAEFAKIVTKLFNLTEVTNKLSYKDKGYTASNWAVPYIEAVTAANLMQGKDTVKGIFDYNGKVTVEEVAAVLFRALKLETPTTTDNTASAWAKGYAQAVINKGLVAQSTNFKGNATRSLVVETAYAVSQLSAFPAIASAEALSPTSVVVTFSDKTTTTVTLTTALVEGVATPVTFTNNGHSYTTTVTLTAPKVVSVTVPNAKQLVVTFNRAIDDSTLASSGKLKAGVIKVIPLGNQAAVTTDGAEVSLNAAGTEATITLPNLEFLKGQYTVVVSDSLKTTAGTAFTAYSALVTVADTVAPTVVTVNSAAKATTNKVYVKFSEPVKPAGIIASVNGVSATVTRETYDTFSLTAGTLNAGTTYDVSLLNVTDFAGNLANPNPIKTSVTVTSDTAAPAITSVTPVGDTAITVKFSKKVSYESLIGNVRLLSAYGDAQGTMVVDADADSDTIKFKVPAGFKLPDSGTFNGSLVFGATVRDTLGNTLGTPVTQSITFVKDATAPTVASAVFSSDKGLVVTFSEAVAWVGGTPTLIKDSTGKVLDTANYSGQTVDGAKLTFPNVKGLDGSYTLRLPAGLVTDLALAKNKVAATTVTVTAAATTTTDSERPVVTSITYLEPTGDAPEIIFTITATDNVGLSVASLRDVNSYTLGSRALPSGSYTQVISSIGTETSPTKAVVEVRVPKTAISKTEVVEFIAFGVTDTAGSASIANSIKPELKDRVKPTLDSAAVSTGDSSLLQLTFSEAIEFGTLNASDFTIIVNNSTTAATISGGFIAGVGNDAGKFYVRLAGYPDLNANNVNSISVKVNADATIQDKAGNSVVGDKTVYAK